MRITLLGKRWDLVFKRLPEDADHHGYCQPPTRVGKKLVVDKSLRGEKRLEIIIHEALHAMFWWLDEVFVEQAARDLARVITSLGYTEESS